MQTLLQIASAMAVIAGLMAVVALLLYGFCWAILLLLRVVPVIGRKHARAVGRADEAIGARVGACSCLLPPNS